MNKMKSNLINLSFCVFLFSLLANTGLSAQEYKSAVGARLGIPLSVSYKTFISETNAIEVYASYRGYSFYNSISATGAYQIHKPIPDVLNGLQWYYGIGATAFLWSYNTGFSSDSGNFSLGLNAYLGLDYKFPNSPISLTSDWVPAFGLTGFGSGFGAGSGALGIRYVFK